MTYTQRFPFAAFLLSVAIAVAVGGCGPVASPRTPLAAAQVLHLNWGANPPDLNPITASDSISFNVLAQTMEGLTRIGAGGRLRPGIASRWSVGPGGTTYTFHLRRAVWQDGRPVTAAEFRWAWLQALDPRNAAGYASQLHYLRGANALLALRLPARQAHPRAYAAAVARIPALEAAVGVRASGARTLVVRLTHPTPYWLALTALPVYDPAQRSRVRAWGMRGYGSGPKHLLSDGPFYVSSWKPGVALDLARNPRYWDAGGVHLTAVDGVMVGDAATTANLYRRGTLDALIPTIPAQEVRQFQGQPGFHTQAAAAAAFVECNLTAGPLKNLAIRQALSLAVDRSAFARAVAGGGAQPAYAYTPPTVDYRPGKPFAPLVGHVLPVHAHPRRARAALAAGLKALGLARLPTLTLITYNVANGREAAAALAAFWRQNLGVSVRVQTLDPATELADVAAGRYQLALSGWGADYNDPTTFLNLWLPGSSFNATRWNNATYASDLRRAETASGRARGVDLAAAERRLLAALPVLPLDWPAQNWIARPNVRGLVMQLTGPQFYLRDVHLG